MLFGGLGIATGWGDFAPIPLGSSRSNCVGHWINLGDHTTADQCRGMGWPTHFYRDWHLVARVVRRKSCRRGVHDLRLARATCDGFSEVMAPDSRSIIGANRMALADADFLLWSSRPSAILRGFIYELVRCQLCAGSSSSEEVTTCFLLAFGLQVFSFTNAEVTDLTPSALSEINRDIASLLGYRAVSRTVLAALQSCFSSGGEYFRVKNLAFDGVPTTFTAFISSQRISTRTQFLLCRPSLSPNPYWKPWRNRSYCPPCSLLRPSNSIPLTASSRSRSRTSPIP